MWLIHRFLETIARIAMAAIFVQSGMNKILHWDETIVYMQSEGIVQNTQIFLGAAACTEVFAGLFLALGFKTRLAAAVLALYLIPVTYTFHHFWDIQAQMLSMQQLSQFMKNLSIFGGLLFIATRSTEE